MIVVVMGVSGSGKSTIGTKLAARLNWTFYDGDDYHPPANLQKMASGRPLNDADRAPWLDILRGIIVRCRSEGRNAVLACSALRESYRRRLSEGGAVKFVYIRGTPDLFAGRLRQRKGHFMPAALLESQFADLEEPAEAIVVDAARSPSEIVSDILAAFRPPVAPAGQP